jgi:hypothetical protein
MKYVGVIGRIVLALAFGLCLLIATAEDPEIVSLDLYHPATLLSLVGNRLHAVQAYVRDFRVSDLIDAATAGFHEGLRHESPPPSPMP